MTNLFGKVKRLLQRHTSKAALFVIPFALIGVYAAFTSFAAVTSIDIEAEGSNLSGATEITDNSASGNKAIRFTGASNDTAVVPGWGSPVWRDEFTYKNGSGQPVVDPTKWNVRTRADLGLTFDAAEPSADMVTVDANGILHLRAKWLDQPYTRTNVPNSFATTITHKTGYMDHRALKTGNVAFAQQYGRWEIRAKVASGPGTYGSLNAFWLRNQNSGEIDIMEAWGFGTQPRTTPDGGQRPGSYTTTIFTDTSTGAGKKFWRPQTPNVYEDFHTYTLEFTPTYFRAYFDGVMTVNETPATSPTLWDTRYWGSPNHVRLNLHVGPNETYWGRPDPARRDLTQDAKMDFQVDYVRIWALN